MQFYQLENNYRTEFCILQNLCQVENVFYLAVIII